MSAGSAGWALRLPCVAVVAFAAGSGLPRDWAPCHTGRRDGHGITIALSYMVGDHIRDGKLLPVLDTFTLPPQPVHLVYPHARLIAPKIRAFIDFAAPRLKTALDQLAWRSAQDATPASSPDASGRKS
jgi:DNA-binding transcriptional LysR family regulator